MASFEQIGLSQPAASTTTHRLDAVSLNRNSTVVLREVLTVGDPDSSNAVAAVLATTPGSTAWGLAVREVVPQSTTVAVSSLGGVVAVAQNSTVWQVQVGGYVAPSTTVAVSSLAVSSGFVKQAGFSVDSSNYLNVNASFSGSTDVTAKQGTAAAPSSAWAVRISDGSTWVTLGNDYTNGSTYSSLTAPGLSFHTDTAYTFKVAGSSTPFPVHLRTSSGADISDSTNGAIKVNVVAGSVAGDTTATVTQASTVWAVQVGGYVAPSTTVAVSTGSVRVIQSTAGDLNVTVAGYSTTVNVSSVAGTVAVKAQLANIQSTQYAQSSAFNNSTAITLESSAAGQRAYVHAYTILSTIATAIVGGFYSSNNLIWPFVFQATSSAVSGANLAVSQPGYLFRTNAAEALSVRVPASSNAGMNVGVSWFVST